jgi:endonuclease/exonuclease/phosphatase family metal-dependent hydrolase
MYPGAGSVRICTVAHFQSASGELTVLVTHWGWLHSQAALIFSYILSDERSDAQRQLAASLILHRAHCEALRTGSPVILLGDFNSPAFGRDNSGYEIITGVRPPVEIDQDFKDRYPVATSSGTFYMIDFIGDAPRPNISGNYGTHAFFLKI